jgi:hypothetical protein
MIQAIIKQTISNQLAIFMPRGYSNLSIMISINYITVIILTLLCLQKPVKLMARNPAPEVTVLVIPREM